MGKLTVAGQINDGAFWRAQKCAEAVVEEDSELTEVEVLSLVPADFEAFLAVKKKEFGGKAWMHMHSPMVFADKIGYIGGSKEFLSWAFDNMKYVDSLSDPVYNQKAISNYKEYMATTECDYAYMQISIDGVDVGKLVFELFANRLPKTCNNFLSLCEGDKATSPTGQKLSYLNSIFHRIVKDGWVQGGDVTKGTGEGGESVYGASFPDENFCTTHDQPGMLGFANAGPHTNNSQFYLTCRPAPFLDQKFVACGRVIDGMNVLRMIEGVDTRNERPIKPVVITACGAYNYTTVK